MRSLIRMGVLIFVEGKVEEGRSNIQTLDLQTHVIGAHNSDLPEPKPTASAPCSPPSR